MTRRLLAAGASLAVLLTACGAADTSTDTTSAGQSGADQGVDASTDGGMAPEGEMAADDPMAAGDFTHPVLQSVATSADGSTFTIADHAGQTVFVETFATWCSTCRRQLGDTNEAASQAPDGAVFLILSVESDLDPAKLATYAAENGFTNLTFGVLDPAGLAAFNDQFGRSVLNAPSTPKFVVQPDGTMGELTTGLESVDEILSQLA